MLRCRIWSHPNYIFYNPWSFRGLVSLALLFVVFPAIYLSCVRKWHVLKYASFTETKRPRLEQTATESSPADEGRDVSVTYVCELPEVKGRFDIEKARKFFNRPGPHYGHLQAGKSVMASDGVTMVRFPFWSCIDVWIEDFIYPVHMGFDQI